MKEGHLVEYDGHVRLLLRIPQGKGKQGYGRHDHRAWSAEEVGPKFAAFICLARLIVDLNDIPRKGLPRLWLTAKPNAMHKIMKPLVGSQRVEGRARKD